ncbi:MAG TPA: NnrU family protein [Gammaproteobacteria bacterium]|nr:NnrU family protein [Gammaproteobacteria bacterium]
MNTSQSYAESASAPPLATRSAVFAYSVIAYAIGMAAIVWLIACLAGLCPLVAPPLQTHSTTGAALVDVGLLILFGLQHSIMARRGFKDWWTRWIAPAAERSTYVLTSGIALGALLWLWQPIEGTVWSVSEPTARIALWALFAAGWLYLVAATYVTSHYDLFGLRQGWYYLRGKPYTPVPFVRSWMYRYSRHPMMAGILVGIWATPQMSATHLVLAFGFSAYIAIGVAFEERGLLAHFGEQYLHYRTEVGALLPRFRG